MRYFCLDANESNISKSFSFSWTSGTINEATYGKSVSEVSKNAVPNLFLETLTVGSENGEPLA